MSSSVFFIVPTKLLSLISYVTEDEFEFGHKMELDMSILGLPEKFDVDYRWVNRGDIENPEELGERMFNGCNVFVASRYGFSKNIAHLFGLLNGMGICATHDCTKPYPKSADKMMHPVTKYKVFDVDGQKVLTMQQHAYIELASDPTIEGPQPSVKYIDQGSIVPHRTFY